MNTGMTTNSTSRLASSFTNIQVHYDRFVVRTNTTPLYYRTIVSITQIYVHAWNNNVVNILGGTDGHGHGHDNKFNKEIDIIIHQHTNPL